MGKGLLQSLKVALAISLLPLHLFAIEPMTCESAAFLDELRNRYKCSWGDVIGCVQSVDSEQTLAWTAAGISLAAPKAIRKGLTKVLKIDRPLVEIRSHLQIMEQARLDFGATDQALKAARDKKIAALNPNDVSGKQKVWEDFLENKKRATSKFVDAVAAEQKYALERIEHLNPDEKTTVKKIVDDSRSGIEARRRMAEIDDDINELKREKAKLSQAAAASHGQTLKETSGRMNEIDNAVKKLVSERRTLKIETEEFFNSVERNTKKIVQGLLSAKSYRLAKFAKFGQTAAEFAGAYLFVWAAKWALLHYVFLSNDYIKKFNLNDDELDIIEEHTSTMPWSVRPFMSDAQIEKINQMARSERAEMMKRNPVLCEIMQEQMQDLRKEREHKSLKLKNLVCEDSPAIQGSYANYDLTFSYTNLDENKIQLNVAVRQEDTLAKYFVNAKYDVHEGWSDVDSNLPTFANINKTSEGDEITGGERALLAINSDDTCKVPLTDLRWTFNLSQQYRAQCFVGQLLKFAALTLPELKIKCQAASAY